MPMHCYLDVADKAGRVAHGEIDQKKCVLKVIVATALN